MIAFSFLIPDSLDSFFKKVAFGKQQGVRGNAEAGRQRKTGKERL